MLTIEEFLGLFSVFNFLLQFVFVRTGPFGSSAGAKVLIGGNPKHVLCPCSQDAKTPRNLVVLETTKKSLPLSRFACKVSTWSTAAPNLASDSSMESPLVGVVLCHFHYAIQAEKLATTSANLN